MASSREGSNVADASATSGTGAVGEGMKWLEELPRSMTTEEEAEARLKEREQWLSSQQDRLFMRQQEILNEKQKHMNFLQGISNKPEKKDDKKGHKQKSQRVDPLLKKVMQKGFAQAVLNETFGQMQALSSEEDGNLA